MIDCSKMRISLEMLKAILHHKHSIVFIEHVKLFPSYPRNVWWIPIPLQAAESPAQLSATNCLGKFHFAPFTLIEYQFTPSYSYFIITHNK